MPKIIFTKGIQGSGKSTWAKEFCVKNTDWVRVNRDDIRNMRGQYWLPKDEDLVSAMELDLIVEALLHNKNVIVDSMNLNIGRDIRGKIEKITSRISINKSVKIQHEIKDFTNVTLAECQRRNLIRPNSIDPDVIQKTWEKYLAPDLAVYEEDINLPECVIFDVDGTLAKMEGRSPYDWNKVDQDTPNAPIAMLCRILYQQGKNIIIFTGRDGSALDKTKDWLRYHVIPYNEIYIRPAGDQRKDSIVKRELFENHIRGKYYCDFIVDDRDQVVDMWRKELGLTCLQVNYGNF